MVPYLLSRSDGDDLRDLVDQACSDAACHVRLLFWWATVAATTRTYSSILDPQAVIKLVTTVACMQLVEKQLLDLDDASVVEQLCPELKNVKVLQADGTLVAKKTRITLRMLLTHTAGFGYSFLNESLRTFRQQNDPSIEEFNEFSGSITDFQQPLVDQPEAAFHYSIGIDRAGILVERASGLTLNDYMARHIFEPLQVKNITMVPLADMAARVTGLWQRNKNGELAPGEYLLQAPLSTSGNGDFFHSGGAGLFGSVREFSKAFTAKHAVGLVLYLQKHTLLSCLGSIV